MRTLLLNPPGYLDFDGGAGARYQNRREVWSNWYPIWLAYPAGMIAGARLLDAQALQLSLVETLAIARDYDHVVLYTSSPTLKGDAQVSSALKAQRPDIIVGMVGPHPTVLPEGTLQDAPAVDYVCRNEFDYSVKEIAEGASFSSVRGIVYRAGDGTCGHTAPRPVDENLDALPWVTRVYKRDLDVEKYNIPWMHWPYASIYTTRGCPAQCTFCLWPQTTSGHRYRKRSVDDVIAEMTWAKDNLSTVKEFFFDDDTFSFEKERTREIARRLKLLGVTWGGNARGNLDYETLRIMKEGGARNLVVGYESSSQQILNNVKKGIRVEKYVEFSRNAKRAGLMIHGAFIVGLPGETEKTLDDTIRFACELDLDTIQISLAAPYPGTQLHDWLVAKGYLKDGGSLVGASGFQDVMVGYPDFPSERIFEGVERFYRRFYFRPRYIGRQVARMVVDRSERKRLLSEGRQFLRFLRERKSRRREAATADPTKPGSLAPNSQGS
jgi:hopanoid biosynthesis associated radical SAM protein HpnJ